MTEIFLPLASITVLFIVLLGVKELLSGKLKEEFCVMCCTVFLTWATLLGLYWKGVFQNQLILALLIGESTLGIFYLIDRKLPKMRLFKLPILLTLIVAGYSLLSIPDDLTKVLCLLGILWVLFIVISIFGAQLGPLISQPLKTTYTIEI